MKRFQLYRFTTLAGVCLCILYLIMPGQPAMAQAQSVPTLLTPGEAISDSMDSMTRRTYAVDLVANQFVYAEIEQQTVDVMVEVYRPDGSIVGAFDSSTSGVEAIRFDTDAEGRFRFVIRSARGEPGRYTVLLRRVEPTAHTPAGRVDQLMAGYDPNAPGAVIAVARDGELVFGKGYGLGNVEYGRPLTPQSVFDLASVSKQFTGFAIALLIERGELSLDDPIQRYIPDFPEYEAPVLIRHLIYHTSGLRNIFPLFFLMRGGDGGSGGSDLIRQEVGLEIIKAQLETNFEPGTEFLYTNEGYVLLAAIVELLSGQSFPQFMQDEVFGPLAMTSTFIRDDHERIIPDRVEGYKRTSQGELRKVVAPMTVQGSTGVYSSAEDLVRWLANLENPRVGGERVVAIMHQVGLLENGEPLNYGSGLDFGEYRGLSLVGHGGHFIGYRNYAGRIPEHDLGVVVLSNGPESPDPVGMAFKVIEIFLDEHLDAEPTFSLNPEALLRFAGDYVDGRGFPVRLVAAGERLFAKVGGGTLYPLTPLDETTFTGMSSWGSGFRVTLDADSEGPVEQGTLSLYGTSPLRRVAAERADQWSPTPEELSEYQGFYYSPELKAGYTVTVDGTGLTASHFPGKAIVLSPSIKDHFAGSRWFFSGAQFDREEGGTITGMRVSAFRLRGLLFKRRNSEDEQHKFPGPP